MITQERVAEREGHVTRRRFFSLVGWGSFAAFFGGAILATLRFFFPRILYEPSQRFSAGKPEDYQVGEVSTRLQKEQLRSSPSVPISAVRPSGGRRKIGLSVRATAATF